jgi:O-6-methylguanine DNA methyltransferase
MKKSANSQFTARVLSVVRRIPAGKVATYGDVAAAAGRPRAWRAVGNIMRDCRAHDVPCHRVIAFAGGLGGYGGNLELKRSLLRAEGVLVSGSRIRDFSVRRWSPFARGLRPPDPLTRSLAGASSPRSARVAHSLRSFAQSRKRTARKRST